MDHSRQPIESAGRRQLEGHAFISYVREDAHHVDRLQDLLEAAGVRVWRDTADLWPGQDWRAEIRRAIQGNALVFIACFSQQSLARDKTFQNEELALAIEQLRLRLPENPWLIPVRFDDCKIPDRDIGAGRTLASIQQADLFGAKSDDNTGRLLEAILRILGPEAVPPARQTPRGRSGQPTAIPTVSPEWRLAFEALSPRAAASLVIGMALDDAAVLLATALVGASAEVLKVILSTDVDLAISLLARMSRPKAQGLVAAMTSAPTWLEQLPDAAEAIAVCADEVGGVLGGSSGRLHHASPSMQGTQGYYQNFKKGQIHWSVRGGAQATRGAIAEYHVALGGSGGRLGFPLTPDMPAQPSRPFETEGSYQRFESSFDYGPETCGRIDLVCGGTVYWSKHGAHATWGGIGEYYELNGGTGGSLGFPVSDEIEVGPSHRDAEPRTTGWCQHFEGGAVYWSEKTEAVAVTRLVADYLDRHHGVASRRGFPVSPDLPAGDSPYGTKGRLQRFEGAWDYPKDILDHWLDVEGPGGATIYTSEAHGVYCVGWGNGILYERLAGTSSWLGFPKSDETDARASEDEPWCTIQEFEGGAIFYKEKYGSVPVSEAIMEYLSQHDGLKQRLGFPVKEASSLAPGNDEQVQFFEHGIVTLRNGVTEVWVRPDDIVPPGLQEVDLLALECSSMTVISGETIDLEYRIQSGPDRAFPVELGASLIAANGDEYFGKTGNRSVDLTPGEKTYRRRMKVPSSAPHGSYRLIGAVWYPRIGQNRLAKLDRGFIVNVIAAEDK